jgi:large conductance mechanosensitive channel
MLEEFKKFALKGNMVDLAIGIIIGVAFGGVVSSLVNDIIMPVIGLLTSGLDFSQMYVQLAGVPQPTLDAARKAGATVAYGNFITLMINFLVVAWVLFFIVRLMNRLRRQKDDVAAAAAPPVPTTQEVLLTEIRDLLAKGAAK